MEEAKSFAHAQKYTPRINVLLCAAVVLFPWMGAAASASVSLPFQERNICGWGIRGEGGGGGEEEAAATKNRLLFLGRIRPTKHRGQKKDDDESVETGPLPSSPSAVPKS